MKAIKGSSTDGDCGANEQCESDEVIVVDDDEGANRNKKDIRERYNGSAGDSEGTNGKHEPTTSKRDEETINGREELKICAQVCNNIHKLYYVHINLLSFLTYRSERQEFLLLGT